MSKGKDIIIKETFEGGLKHALFSNFSNYIEAFLELVDNAVSNRIQGKELFVEILTNPKFLVIKNIGGYGMGVSELQGFFKWGEEKERREYDLGEYSQGGKAAMGYLGRAMIVIASPHAKKFAYRIEDDNLHKHDLKKYIVQEVPHSSSDGYVSIEVRELRRNINDNKLREALIETYRPLIESKDVIFLYNGSKLKTTVFPIEGNKNEFLKNELKGWVGYLTPRSGVKGGIRCYKLGRLICEREFFGHPDASYKQTLNFLFGEVHLDGVPVTTNKTNFDRDSDEWLNAQKTMYEILEPFVRDLLGRDIKEPTEEEKERTKEAKEIFSELMRIRQKELEGLTGITGEAFGQKESERSDTKSVGVSTSTGRKNEPRTSPPANSKGNRRRLKKFMEWVLDSIEEGLRSKIRVDKDGNKTLVINNLFPGYVAAKGTILYQIETATIQLALPEEGEKITPEEYIANFDELYSFCCEHFEEAKEAFSKKKKPKK